MKNIVLIFAIFLCLASSINAETEPDFSLVPPTCQNQTVGNSLSLIMTLMVFGQVQPQQPEVPCEPTAWPWCYGEGESIGNFCKVQRISVWFGYGYVDFCRHCCPTPDWGSTCGQPYPC